MFENYYFKGKNGYLAKSFKNKNNTVLIKVEGK